MTLIELVENHEPNTLDELERVIQNHNFATYDSVLLVKPSARSRTMNIKPTSAKALPTAYGATCSKSY